MSRINLLVVICKCSDHRHDKNLAVRYCYQDVTSSHMQSLEQREVSCRLSPELGRSSGNVFVKAIVSGYIQTAESFGHFIKFRSFKFSIGRL